MNTATQKDFMEIVKGRRSIRVYDENVKISKEEMTQILEEATTAPS
ncbi:MAG: nitroreductase family protein, partial [Exiguobacterium sp.]